MIYIKILATIFIVSTMLALATAGNDLLHKVLWPVVVASGIGLIVAEIWVLF